MVWLLLTSLILLAQQYHYLRDERNEERSVNKCLRERIEELTAQRLYHKQLLALQQEELQTERRCSESAIKQAQIWSERAIKLGFYRRQHKNVVRDARRQRRNHKD